MDFTSSVANISADVRHYLHQRAREELPYLSDHALQDILERATSLIHEELIAQKDATDASKERINFYSLPPELRNHIYELVMDSEEYKLNIEFSYGFKSMHGYTPEDGLGLLHVSKQIRAEALPVYWNNITFSTIKITAIICAEEVSKTESLRWHVKELGEPTELMHNFFKAIGPQQCRAISSLSLEILFWPKMVPRSEEWVFEELKLGVYGFEAKSVKILFDDALAMEEMIQLTEQFRSR